MVALFNLSANSKKIIANRTKSGFPVSIGTGLALETIFDPVEEVYDPNREVPERIDRTKYDIYLFNISTLVRNIINSINTNDVVRVRKDDYLETTLEEIEWLKGYFELNQLNIHFYTHSYVYVKKTYSEERLRIVSTPKQALRDSIVSYVLSKVDRELPFIHHFDKNIDLKAKKSNVLIFTHIPFDLLSYRYFLNMDLLESHTGVVKDRSKFNTKYYPLPNEDMSFLPFFEYLLADVFGDHVMFRPNKLEIRKKVYNQLVQLKVHPLSTEIGLLKHI